MFYLHGEVGGQIGGNFLIHFSYAMPYVYLDTWSYLWRFLKYDTSDPAQILERNFERP